jgi:hypothetical protein
MSMARIRAAVAPRYERVKLLSRRVRSQVVLQVSAPKEYVFIVSSGRSGSTLVQGLLNSLPGVLVRGENSFYVLPLYRAFRGALDFKQTYGARSKDVTSAFYGMAETYPRDFPKTFRQLMTRQLVGSQSPRGLKVIGFKEVRWEHLQPKEYGSFFDFFEKVFPKARYILNERNPENVVGSGQWLRVDADTALHELAKGRQVRDWLRENRPNQVYETTFEVITGSDDAAKDAQLKGLAEFVLGRSDQAVLDGMRAVLAVGHGPFPFGKARGRRQAGSEPLDPAAEHILDTGAG